MQKKLQIRKKIPPTKTKIQFVAQSTHAFTKTRKHSCIWNPIWERERERATLTSAQLPLSSPFKSYLTHGLSVKSGSVIKKPN